MFDHLLCDLDGTLVDSSDGILDSLRRSLQNAGFRSHVELSSALIGPPLRALVAAAVGSSDPVVLADCEAAFRDEYDERGYLATRPYPGTTEALREMHSKAVRLHLVTNKRLTPTLRILEALGWSGFFSSVGTLDSCDSAKSKTDVVARLLQQFDIRGSSAALVGDSADDAAASRDNGVAFAWASWGYGRDPALATQGVTLTNLRHLVRYALHMDA
jgi:phosphoglycolate phosphatase